jgi:hypothetical protein
MPLDAPVMIAMGRFSPRRANAGTDAGTAVTTQALRLRNEMRAGSLDPVRGLF